MDADSQARQLLDRMALDFAQLIKRSDVDFFAKGTVAPNTAGGPMPGNDRIAFYSNVPGYYPSTGSQSPVSVVAYRVNGDSTSSSYNKLERMGKGLIWNGVSPTDTPVVFMPLTIGPSASSVRGTWPAATSSSISDAAYEVIGPQVFRFEYRYLRTDGSLSIIPPTNVSGIAAIVVDIAVVDDKSRALVPAAKLARLNGADGSSPALVDYNIGMSPGQLLAQWRAVLDANTVGLPRPAISGVRLYERSFYLSPPTL